MRFTSLAKPEYVLRPAQMLRRIRNQFAPPPADSVIVTLPWGWAIEVQSGEVIGRCLVNIGIYDLAISELLWRLCDPGETAVDAGANIGCMTSILAYRAGPHGHVFSFEAHPEISGQLLRNVDRWRTLPSAKINVVAKALSNREGIVEFELPGDFATNRGTGRVVPHVEGQDTSSTFTVDCGTLDTFLNNEPAIGVAKMDVEGHEEAVLQGASRLLQERRVRDWIFEHNESYPSPVTDIFERSGYALFQVQKRFLGPDLVPMSQSFRRSSWEPQSYLATLDPTRAQDRARPRGWRVLSGQP
jgi:FkbM family methyltransferase